MRRRTFPLGSRLFQTCNRRPNTAGKRKEISMNPLIGLKRTVPRLLVVIALFCSGLLPTAKALLPPPAPDGGYPGGNTAEGRDALLNLTTGVWNTATGYQALNGDTTGHQNTATGFHSLFSNTIGGQNTASGALSLFSNVDGSGNTADGYRALARNTSGHFNTAVGAQ